MNGYTRSVAAVLVLGLIPSCGGALRYASAPLGDYATYQPFARYTETQALEIELEKAGYVTVMSVFADARHPEVPVVFKPWYPAAEGEESFLERGRHRVRHVPPAELMPRNCGAAEKPSLAGCRRPLWYYLPDVSNPVLAARSPYNYVVLVTQSELDPYELADDLYHMTRESEALDRALRAYNAEAAAPVLERALLDRRGPIVLAGVYVAARLQ